MASLEPVAHPWVAPYAVRRLAPDDMALAYPLARLVHARASLTDWRRYGASLAGRGGQAGGGVLGARDARGYFHGLCTFMPLPELAGRRLAVSHVVLAELIDSGAIITGLADVLETLATQLDCDAIGLELPITGSVDDFAPRFLARLSPAWRARTRVYEMS